MNDDALSRRITRQKCLKAAIDYFSNVYTEEEHISVSDVLDLAEKLERWVYEV